MNDDFITTLLDSLNQATCLKAGIVPVESWDYEPSKIGEQLRSLPPDEARRMKRRFRKLWRREVKEMRGGPTGGKKWRQRQSRIDRNYGKTGTQPTHPQQRNRRRLVAQVMMSKSRDDNAEMINAVYKSMGV